MLRYSARPLKGTEFEMFKMPKSSSKSRGVVIAIEETGPADFVRSTPSKAYMPKVQASESTPGPVSSMLSKVPHEDTHHKPLTAPNRLSPALLCLLVSPAGKKVAPRAPASSPTPVRSNSIGSASATSPVMRSMFPRYDPKIPLAKQYYYPDHDIHRGLAATNLQIPRPSSSSAARFPSQVETLSSNPTQVDTRSPEAIPNGQNDVPVHLSERTELAPATSTPEELLDLWSVANGQGSQEAAETYTLKLSWYSSTFCQLLKASADKIQSRS